MARDPESFRASDERTDAREQAVIFLYESEQRSMSPLELLADRGVASADLTGELLNGIEAHRVAIDEAIVTHAKGWALDRMPALKVLSNTLPFFKLRNLVRTNAPPFPGLTCWNSTTVKSPLSSSSVIPFFRSFVVIAGM